MNQNALLTWAAPVFLGLVGVEAWVSHRRRLGVVRLADSLTSLGCGIWTVTVEVFTKGLLLAAYAWVEARLGIFDFASDDVSTWVLFFFVLDFLYYWAHRWSHEVNVLWGGHVPHHQSEEYNLSTALRQGAFQDTQHFPIFLPMALVGCPADVFIVLLTFSKFYQFWIHTRLIDRVPLIEGILNTPSAHRVHHAVNDGYLDKNHGGTLMIWDRLFGTWAPEVEPCVFGVRKPYHRWDPVWAHFDWFADLFRDARRAGSLRDRIRIWFAATGWRPEDVAREDPKPPFVLANAARFTAVRGGRWNAAAVVCLVVAAVAQSVLVARAGSLSLAERLGLAVVVTVFLVAMARSLDPSRAPAGEN